MREAAANPTSNFHRYKSNTWIYTLPDPRDRRAGKKGEKWKRKARQGKAREKEDFERTIFLNRKSNTNPDESVQSELASLSYSTSSENSSRFCAKHHARKHWHPILDITLITFKLCTF